MRSRLLSLILLFSAAAWAQGESLSLSPAAGAAPGTVSLNLLLSSAGGQHPAGVQWTLTYSSVDFTAIEVTAGPTAVAAGKSVNCAGDSRAYKCLVVGVNQGTIADGVLSVISLTVSPSTLDTTSFIQIQNALGVSLGGTAIAISATGYSATITPAVGVSPSALFVPVSPCRVADTRNAKGALGGPAIAGGASRDFLILDSSCGIPANAAAYSLNVTVIPQRALGFLTVWPTGQSQPGVSTLNSPAGRITSNAAIVPAGANGAITVFASDTTDVVLDINGYSIASTDTGALAFYPLTPCRVVDTRGTAGLLGGPGLAAVSTRAFPITEGPCTVPEAARAYSLNFTATPKGPLSYLTVWPSGQLQPFVSALNDVAGTVTTNAVIVPAGANGDIDVFATDATDLTIDTNGYFAAPGTGGLSLYNLPPCRVLDTRQNGGSPLHGTKEVTVSGACGVPPAAQAYVLNVTVMPPGAFDYLSLGPHGAKQPAVPALNSVEGIASNLAIVPAANGAIDVYASNPTHLILDISGYFAP